MSIWAFLPKACTFCFCWPHFFSDELLCYFCRLFRSRLCINSAHFLLVSLHSSHYVARETYCQDRDWDRIGLNTEWTVSWESVRLEGTLPPVTLNEETERLKCHHSFVPPLLFISMNKAQQFQKVFTRRKNSELSQKLNACHVVSGLSPGIPRIACSRVCLCALCPYID